MSTIDPTLHVVLVRAGDRREYRIDVSEVVDAWPFWIDRGGASLPTFGLINGPEAVLQLKVELEAEIAGLRDEGWRDWHPMWSI